MGAIPEAMQRERFADQCRERGVLDEYEALLAKGNPPGFAAMLALQSPPGSRNTDRAFSQGQVAKMNRMPKRNRDNIIRIAQKAGIRTDGKFYMSGLGKYDNPAAWVSCAQDVIESAKVQKLDVEGAVNFKAARHDTKPPKSIPLAEDLVVEMAQREMKANPALAEKVRKSKKAQGELREKVIAKYGKQKKR